MNHILVRAALVWLGFAPLAYFLDRTDLFHLLNAGVFCTASAVLITYMPAIIQAIKEGTKLTRAHYLILGIASVWFALLLRTSMLWTWRYFDKQTDLIDHWLFAFGFYMIITGGFLYLAAYDFVESPRNTYWRRVGIILGIAMAIAYLAITITSPELSKTLDVFRW